MIVKTLDIKHEIHAQMGQNLKRIRQHNGLSQKALAHLLGVSFQQIQKYEMGANRMRLEHIIFIKNYFSLHYDHIFPSDSATINSTKIKFRDPVREKIFEKIIMDLHDIRDMTTLENMHKIISIFKY